MNRSLLLLPLAVMLTGAAQAKPFIFYRSIFNAASYASPGLPNGSLARGSIFSIFGRDLGPADGVQALTFPLQDELAGVSIDVCQGQTCSAAIPLFVRADQINAILRSDAPLGEVSIRVNYNGEAGNLSPATVVDSSVGLFAVNSAGYGPGVVQDYVDENSTPLNSASVTTTRGGTMIAWGTGLGAGLNADNVNPAAGDLAADVEIFLGEARVTKILYHGRTPCCAAVDEFVFETPADAPLGCYVPLSIRTNHQVVSNQVTVAVTADGGPCDPGDDAAHEALVNGDRIGGVVLNQIERQDRHQGVDFTQQSEVAEAYFSDEPGGPFAYTPFYSRPPAGSCFVSQARSAEPATTLRPGLAPVVDLDAGAMLTMQGGNGSGKIGRNVLGRPGYADVVGLRDPISGIDNLQLEGAGQVTISGAGGADVGGFSVTVPVGERITWLNEDQINAMDRSAGVTVTWSPTGAGFVSISGGTRDLVTNTTVWFDCLADGSAGTFTVEPYVLSNLAPPRARESQQEAWIGLTAVPASGTGFTADGIERGFAAAYAPVVKTVEVR